MAGSSSSSKVMTTSDGDNTPIASRYVRALLNRHDVPSSRHVTTAAQILGMGYALVHRRMTGATAWEFEEIAKVAEHFGESIARVFAEESADEYEAAVLVAGSARTSCQLIVGPPAREPDRASLVAIRAGDQWLVMPAADAGGGACFEVRRLLIIGRGDHRWRIAVLDDDPVETANTKRHFSDLGCEVQAFHSVADLVGQMKVRPFDAYVIDWVLHEGSAAEVIGMIRADDRQCPIAILSGKLVSDLMVEPAVAEAVSMFKLHFYEKPTRLSIISARLLRELAGQ
jgi:ActR/RegA family two-component response regulator